MRDGSGRISRRVCQRKIEGIEPQITRPAYIRTFYLTLILSTTPATQGVYTKPISSDVVTGLTDLITI